MSEDTQKVAGYRKLSQDELDLINEIKAAEDALLALWQQARSRAHAGDSVEAGDHHHMARWTSLARTHFETGFMYLTKAVARPTNGFGRNE